MALDIEYLFYGVTIIFIILIVWWCSIKLKELKKKKEFKTNII